MTTFLTRETEDAESGGAVLRLSGRLEASEATLLREECTRLREEKNTNCVFVLLHEITFIASSGIGSLLLLTEEYRNLGGHFLLVDPSEAVTSVVELLNLKNLLDIVDSVDDARRHVGAMA